jgi:hypothetical protein
VHDTGRTIPGQARWPCSPAFALSLNPRSPAVPQNLAACPFPRDHAVQADRDNRIQTNRAP